MRGEVWGGEFLATQTIFFFCPLLFVFVFGIEMSSRCLVLSCSVVSLSWLVLLSCLVLSCLVLCYCLALSCLALSCLVLSCLPSVTLTHDLSLTWPFLAALDASFCAANACASAAILLVLSLLLFPSSLLWNFSSALKKIKGCEIGKAIKTRQTR